MANAPLPFDRAIQKLQILSKLSGMNLNTQIKTPLEALKYRSVYAFNLIYMLTSLSSAFACFIVEATLEKSFLELSSLAPCVTFSAVAVLKSLLHLFYEKEVLKLISTLRDLAVNENKRPKSIEKEKIIKEDSDFLNAVINVLYFLNCSMIVVFNVPPLIFIAVKYFKTNEVELLLPYMNMFLFIPYELKYWPFLYIYETWSECLALLDMATADCLFFTCCVYIKIQFRLLKYEFERIISEVKPSEEVDEEEFRTKLMELVKWHQEVIGSSDRLEIIYSKSNLFNFLASSLVICLTGFNVTMVDDIAVVVTFLTFLFMSLLQIFFLCFFADMLMSASTDVSEAVYNSRWYLAYHNIGKHLLLVQTRAQKACKITALGFSDVNLRAFARVLSTSWSYFALLRTMYEG